MRLHIHTYFSISKLRLRLPNVVWGFTLAVLALCALTGAATLVAAHATPTGLGHFPAVEATSLDKTRLNLPADFGGNMNLVMISFAREQQLDVDSWLPTARQLELQHPRMRYYELPTTARENLLYRWWFNSALRSNNTDPALAGRILTLYVNKGQFRQSLRIPNEKKITVLLVDRDGKILWQSRGDFTADKGQALTAVLATSGS